MESLQNVEALRSNEELDAIIGTAIKEVISLFGEGMTERDKGLLESVMKELSTLPLGRIVYLRQLQDSVGVSDKIGEYVDAIMQTLRQKFNTAEIAACNSPFGGSMLD